LAKILLAFFIFPCCIHVSIVGPEPFTSGTYRGVAETDTIVTCQIRVFWRVLFLSLEDPPREDEETSFGQRHPESTFVGCLVRLFVWSRDWRR